MRASINHSTISQKFVTWQFTRKLQQAFLEDLLSLIEDGVAASAAIDTMTKITTGITLKVAQSISRAIASGKLLADGMQGWFTPAVVEIIRAGETSGTLPQALKSAVNSFAQHVDALNMIITSMLYPIIVLCLALVMVVVIKNTVLDNFATIKPIVMWPSLGKNLYRFATIVQLWWWLFVLLIVGLTISCVYLLRYYTGNFRKSIDSLPLLSLYRNAVAARFMETLGLLISNGVVVKKALNVMQAGACPYLSWHLFKMEYRLSGGKENMADVLDTDLINPDELLRLRVVARGKGFEQALISLGRKAYARNAKVIKLTARISGGLLLVASATLAANIVLGIYTVGSVIAS